MNVILFGFKGCGKTTLGKAVANHFHYSFIDTDELLGPSIRSLYHAVGEETFRQLETKAIAKLTTVSHSIISVGGGTMMNPINVHLLSHLGTLIYLKVDKATLKQRNCTPPLPAILDPRNPKASFEDIYASRSAIYESIPALHIDLSGKECNAAICTLCDMLKGDIHGT